MADNTGRTQMALLPAFPAPDQIAGTVEKASSTQADVRAPPTNNKSSSRRSGVWSGSPAQQQLNHFGLPFGLAPATAPRPMFELRQSITIKLTSVWGLVRLRLLQRHQGRRAFRRVDFTDHIDEHNLFFPKSPQLAI
ncbi:hypothetical protein AYL99_11950 [Fonsecaea erecta]|uniref:Uncharacterized protein n=1 Tax=Fonsecaea erecta TaxID=1367422 RepID=A0A178Z294_9EURO|nr:hypothetical protein AYL99_11950 [Fonsecaea erecta]OAP53928.1 hypothetical protein AYL99_11950 [Fonsecaea erecta]